MSNQIERLRYYDGEYLRSYDFTDEQKYHIEMRRRLNHKLHLRGIVNGLHIVPDQESAPDAIFYSISSGMAIDHSGREIYVPAPYSLSPENVLNRPNLKANETYEVWLCYREAQTGLPAAGYRDCNERNQQTRWQETFEVVLRLMDTTKTGHVRPECGGVQLGTVKLENGKYGLQISSNSPPTAVGRTYVGIRAQRVVAAEQQVDTFKIDTQNVDPSDRVPLPGYLDIEPGILARGNLIVEDNVVIGDDFPNATDPKLPPSLPAAGNLKVTNDLFLKGDFYGLAGGKWLSLKDYIKTLVPDVQADKVEIDIAPPTGHPTSDTFAKTVKTSLPSFKFPPQCMVALQWIDWQDQGTLTKWFAGSVPGDIDLRVVAQPQVKDAQSIDLEITWTIGPPVQLGKATDPPTLPIKKLTVGYVIIFQP